MADYATVAEVKAQIQKIGSESDAVIAVIITAVSQEIDKIANRPDGFVATEFAEERIYTGSGTQVQNIDDTVEITEVAVKDSSTDTAYTAWLATDWIPFSGDERFPVFNRLPYTAVMVDPSGDQAVFTSGTFVSRVGFRYAIYPRVERRRGVPTVRITAKWGYSVSVPPVVNQVCIIESARAWKRGQSAFADALATSELGDLRFVAALDPASKQMLVGARLVRPAVGKSP